MKNISTLALLGASLSLGASAVVGQGSPSFRSADFIFVVDESGSMSGEQDFLQAQIPSLDAGLSGVNVTGSRYALVGFGANNPEPRQFQVGAGQFGTPAEFQAAAANLVVSGSFEDGYAGIAYALQNYTFRQGVLPVVVLVTDEDRDVLGSASGETAETIKSALRQTNATWVSIVGQGFLDSDGAPVADALVLNSQGRVFVADGAGGVTTLDGGQLATTGDGIPEDYSTPTLENGGLVADLNQLREGGLTADSFTEAFLQSLIRVVNVNLGLIQLENDVRFRAFAGVFGPLVRGDADVADVFNIVSADPGLFSARIRQLQGYRYAGAGRSSTDGAFNYTFVLNNRFDELQRETLGRISAGDETVSADRRWGGFAQSAFSWSDTEVSSESVTGADANNWGALAGVDYAISNRLHVGVAIGHKDTDETDSNDIFSSTLEGETESVNAYAALYLAPGFFLEGTLGLGFADLSNSRELGGGTSAEGDIDQRITNLALRATVPLHYRGLDYGARAQLQWVRVDTDTTRESGAGALNLTIPSHDEDAVRSLLGAYAEYPMTLAGRRWIPRVALDWVHEFDDPDSLTVYFSNTGPGSSFQLESDEIAEDSVRLSLGSTFYITDFTSAYLNYIHRFEAADRTDDVLHVGVNFRF